MSEVELGALGVLPGPGPSNRLGRAIAVPVAATSSGVVVMGGDCVLLGWSFRESTGTGGALAEVYDGGGSGGVLLGIIDLTGSQDSLAVRTPAASSLSGANAQQAPSIGGAAGTTAFVTGLQILGDGATAGSTITATLAGVLGGTISIPVVVPTGIAVAITPIVMAFGGDGLQASGVGQAITLTLPAFGAGNTLEEAALQGYVRATGGVARSQWFGDEGILVQSGLFLSPVVGSLKGTFWVRR